jgi:hypothetical protein
MAWLKKCYMIFIHSKAVTSFYNIEVMIKLNDHSGTNILTNVMFDISISITFQQKA